MVGIPSHPPGVSRKSTMPLGTNPTQSPIAIMPPATITSARNLDSNEVFCNLIELIEACIQMVRKLNESKLYCRLDCNYIKVISDDEVKVNQLDINLFMNVKANLSNDMSADPMHGLEI